MMSPEQRRTLNDLLERQERQNRPAPDPVDLVHLKHAQHIAEARRGIVSGTSNLTILMLVSLAEDLNNHLAALDHGEGWHSGMDADMARLVDLLNSSDDALEAM